MKKKRRYQLIINDASRLERVADISLPPWKLGAAAGVLLLLAVLISGLLIMLTPLRQLLPGYLKKDERAATEQGLLQLDSLQRDFERNEAYISNLLNILDTERPVFDTVAPTRTATALTPDSLMEPSAEERNFVKMMQEREKYNISVLAPLDAEDLMFYPVSDESVVTAESRDKRVACIAMARRAPVGCIADGSVIAQYRSGATGKYSIVIQHPKGFTSRYSGLDSPLTDQGDIVSGGQIIALSPDTPDGCISLELWHDGDPLVPYGYIVQPASRTDSESPLSGRPMGR